MVLLRYCYYVYDAIIINCINTTISKAFAGRSVSCSINLIVTHITLVVVSIVVLCISLYINSVNRLLLLCIVVSIVLLLVVYCYGVYDAIANNTNTLMPKAFARRITSCSINSMADILLLCLQCYYQ